MLDKEKTAMQELIECIRLTSDNIRKCGDSEMAKTLHHLSDDWEIEFMPLEHKQIVDSYITGCHDGYNFGMNLNDPDELKNYALQEYASKYGSDGTAEH